MPVDFFSTIMCVYILCIILEAHIACIILFQISSVQKFIMFAETNFNIYLATRAISTPFIMYRSDDPCLKLETII